MTWLRLDDHFPTHPKVVAAGGDAAWLHVCALCYCAEHLTDGLVPRALVGRLSDRRKAPELTARLVEVGLWSEEGDAYRLHDYLEYNPSRETVTTERERKQAAGRKGAQARWQPPCDSDDTSHGISHSNGNGVAGGSSMPPSRPVPSAPTERAPTAKKRTPLTPDWQPSESTKEWCRREFPEYAKVGVLDAFRDHHIAKGSLMKDWDRAFMTWVRRQPEFDRERRGPARTHL